MSADMEDMALRFLAVELRIQGIEAKLDELLALLQPEKREYVSMHNAEQWTHTGGDCSVVGCTLVAPHVHPPFVHDPNGGRR